MRTSIVFVIIIILVIKSNQKLLSYHVNENFYLAFVIIIFSCHNITLIYITPTKEIWSYHANENFYRLCDYYYPCHKIQTKNTVLSREWELLSSFVIIIFSCHIFISPSFDITPTKEIWSYHAWMRTSNVFMISIILVIKSNQKLLSNHVNENFYRFCDNYYLCHIIHPKTTVLSRE